MLEQLIGFYGYSVQGMAGYFISQCLNMFRDQQASFQTQMRDAMQNLPMSSAFGEMAKQNLDMWKQMQDTFFKNALLTPRKKSDEPE